MDFSENDDRWAFAIHKTDGARMAPNLLGVFNWQESKKLEGGQQKSDNVGFKPIVGSNNGRRLPLLGILILFLGITVLNNIQIMLGTTLL